MASFPLDSRPLVDHGKCATGIWKYLLVELLRQSERQITYQEEGVCGLEQTSQGVVPSSKGSKDTKDTSCSVERDICATSCGREVVRERQHQEGEIQREEEEEESNSGLECTHEHDEGEDELERYLSASRDLLEVV